MLCARHATKAPEPRVRAAALRCIAACVSGAGRSMSPKSSEAALKLALRVGAADKEVCVCTAAAAVLADLCVSGAGEKALCATLSFDQCATACISALEAGAGASTSGGNDGEDGDAGIDAFAHQAYRAQHVRALAALVTCASSDEVHAILEKTSGRDRDKLTKQVDKAWRVYLAQPFGTRVRMPGAAAARVRAGVAEAWAVAVASAAACGKGAHARQLCSEALSSLAAAGASKSSGGALAPETADALAHARACILHVVCAGGVQQLPPEELAVLIPQLLSGGAGGGTSADRTNAPARQQSGAHASTSLRATSVALHTLGKADSSLQQQLESRITEMVSAQDIRTRQAAAATLAALVRSVPERATGLLAQAFEVLHTARSALAAARGAAPAPSRFGRASAATREQEQKVRLLECTLDGWARAAGALLHAAEELEHGVPSALVLQAISEVKGLVLDHSQAGAPERSAGYALAASVAALEGNGDEVSGTLATEIASAVSTSFSARAQPRVIELVKAPAAFCAELGWRADALCAIRALYVSAKARAHAPGPQAKGRLGDILAFAAGAIDGALGILTAKEVRAAAASGKNPQVAHSVNALAFHTVQLAESAPAMLEHLKAAKALLALCLASGGLAGGWPTEPRASVADLISELSREDDILGPAVAGADEQVDALHALEYGGGDALVAASWDAATEAAFAQQQSLSAALTTCALRALAQCFSVSPPAMQKQIMESVHSRATARAGGLTVSAIALLLAMKVAAARGCKVDNDALALAARTAQVLLGTPWRGLRRAGAECLALTCKLGGADAAERKCKVLSQRVKADPAGLATPAAALALGSINRSVGGMALRAAVGRSVDALMTAAARPTDGRDHHVWALHALALVAQSAGAAYVPRVRSVLELATNLLMVDAATTAALGQCVARIVNASIATIGPELTPGSAVYTQCAAVVGEVTGEDAMGYARGEYTSDPATAMESVMFAQQLALFAPQMPPRLGVLRRTLRSRQPRLRRAAAVTLRHLVESGAPAVCAVDAWGAGLERDLFAALDRETEASVTDVLRQTITRLLDTQCESHPRRWIAVCSSIALDATLGTGASLNSTVSDGGGESEGGDVAFEDDGGGEDGIGGGADDDSGAVATAPPPPDSAASGAAGRASSSDHLEADASDAKLGFKTRAFAAECLLRVPGSVGDNRAHFDLALARESSGGEWLVLHLGEAIGLGYKLATCDAQGLRVWGLRLLVRLMGVFRDAADPDIEGHMLLEQFQVQVMSALRSNSTSAPSSGDASANGDGGDQSASAAPAPPDVVAGTAQLAAGFVVAQAAAGDVQSLKRVVSVLAKHAAQVLGNGAARAPQYAGYAEWVGAHVRREVLVAAADVAVWRAGVTGASSTPGAEAEAGVVDVLLLEPHGEALRAGWLELLKGEIVRAHECDGSEASSRASQLFEVICSVDSRADGGGSADADLLLAVAVMLLRETDRDAALAAAIRALPALLEGCSDDALATEALAAVCEPRTDLHWRVLLRAGAGGSAAHRALARRAFADAGPDFVARLARLAASDDGAVAHMGLLASGAALLDDDAERAAFLSVALPTLARVGGGTAGSIIQRLARAAQVPFAAVVGALPPNVKAQLQQALGAGVASNATPGAARAPVAATPAAPANTPGFAFATAARK